MRLADSSVKRWLLAAAVLLAVPCLLLAFIWYDNNRAVPAPTEDEIRISFQRGVTWLDHNQDAALAQNNPVIWWFISEAGRETANDVLNELAGAYRRRYIDGQPGNPWRFLFDPQSPGTITDAPLYFADYTVLFLYGISCSERLREEPAVVAMLDPEHCAPLLMPILDPTCRTHQLVGMRFIQRNRCEAPDPTRAIIDHLQKGILVEATWDARRDDAYV